MSSVVPNYQNNFLTMDALLKSTPFSCDTFIALPPATPTGTVVFGKNSDRPGTEVQEVVSHPVAKHPAGSRLKCTYIEIDEVPQTHAVVLSKPAWMWGAEMGANDHGVVIGNEAVFTHLTGSEGSTERLIGMDYVRLGLERGSSAREALNVITALLKVYGQGGRCFEDPDWAAITYCNSFIIADASEAWVLETAGRHWAAVKLTSGVRNISNMLSIGSDIDLMSDGLKELAVEMGLWDPAVKTDFNFAEVFATSSPVKRPTKGTALYRMTEGRKLLESFSSAGEFDASAMFSILRNEDSGICCTGIGGASVSTGSQVSVLRAGGLVDPTRPFPGINVHWFTATPNPARSVFKPFVFPVSSGAKPGENPGVVPAVQSPVFGETDPVKKRPRFQTSVDRRHPLYRAHACVPPIGGNPDERLLSGMRELERHLLEDVKKRSKGADGASGLVEMFGVAVGDEMKLYEGCSKR